MPINITAQTHHAACQAKKNAMLISSAASIVTLMENRILPRSCVAVSYTHLFLGSDSSFHRRRPIFTASGASCCFFLPLKIRSVACLVAGAKAAKKGTPKESSVHR